MRYLDVAAVGGEVHLHDEARYVPAAVDTVELWPESQVVEIHCALGGTHSQVPGVWTETEEKTNRSWLCLRDVSDIIFSFLIPSDSDS